jgi:hypothetical protein
LEFSGFSSKHYIFSNLKTEIKIEIAARKTPRFIVGVELKKALNNGGSKKSQKEIPVACDNQLGSFC